MKKRKEQKEKTRKLLIETAHQMFAQNGFLATKTLDVSHAAAVSHGALFVHFPNRENLLIKVIDDFGLKLGEKLQELSVKSDSAKTVLKLHLSLIQEDESFYARLVVEAPLLPPLIRSRILMIQSGLACHLEKLLSEQIKKVIPIHYILNSWLGLIHYYLANRDLFAPGQSVIARHGDELLHYFCQTHQL